MAEIILATESNRSRSPQLSNATLLNYLVEAQPKEAKSQVPLFGCAGIDAFATTSGMPCRGMIQFQNTAWGVFGDTLWRIDDNGFTQNSGSGIGGTNPVGISENGLQIIIVNGQKGWTYDPTAGLEVITDSAFYPSRTVDFFDGYFVLERRDTNQFYWSEPYNGRSYIGTAFATAEAQPGEVQAVIQNIQFLYVFSSTHIELWYDAGTAGAVPFQRYAGGVIPYGTLSPYSILRQDGSLFFLGRDGIFYRLQANQPTRISTHAIEYLVSLEGQLNKVEAFTFTLQGHKLIFWTLPNIDVTICYDISTGKWHDRDSVDANFESLGRWRGRYALKFENDILLGDAFDGRVGKANWNSTFTEYDLPMRGVVSSITQHADRMNLFCSRFELDIQAGVGLITGQGDNPQMMLRTSRDGGMTYGINQPWRSMGRAGEYTKRLRWLRQGKARQFSWQIVCTDPVRRTIIAAHADIEKGVA